MVKAIIQFSINGFITQHIDIPQNIINKYEDEIEKDNPDFKMLDSLLEPYIKYDEISEQLDEPIDIELCTN